MNIGRFRDIKGYGHRGHIDGIHARRSDIARLARIQYGVVNAYRNRTVPDLNIRTIATRRGIRIDILASAGGREIVAGAANPNRRHRGPHLVGIRSEVADRATDCTQAAAQQRKNTLAFFRFRLVEGQLLNPELGFRQQGHAALILKTQHRVGF